MKRTEAGARQAPGGLAFLYDALGVLVSDASSGAFTPRGRFEDRVGDNQHQLIGRVCGRVVVVDVDCVVGAAPSLTAKDDKDDESA